MEAESASQAPTEPDSLSGFSEATEQWFRRTFGSATATQEQGWKPIQQGSHTLLVAPTGSGKTLAAFLWSIDKLTRETTPADDRRCRVLYVSPMKALAYDIERNLQNPLTGIAAVAKERGSKIPNLRVGMRTGDTSTAERRMFPKQPPDILVTTPESLYLLLTSRAREALRAVETIIVDEVHVMVGTKRGAHLALSLERLDALLSRPAQRIGLSATVRPTEEAARFIGGANSHVEIVAPPTPKVMEVTVSVPVADMTAIESTDERNRENPLWPAIEQRVYELVCEYRSSIVFVNSRGMAEKLCARLNALAADVTPTSQPAAHPAQSATSAGVAPIVARAHHGSVSREERKEIEEQLKEGSLPAVVATSTLELGIDMSAVDLVVLVGAPSNVASGVQRVGRAGHQVEAVSEGVMVPVHRGDLLVSSVVAERMREGLIEEIRMPRYPLDVLTQQVVAMVAMDSWHVDDLAELVRRAAPYAELPSRALHAVLDMAAGRYPSTEFAALRPSIVWDRRSGTLTARRHAQRLAVTNAGTIPDRGNFGVFLAEGGSGSRVGELDEIMVYESRVGDIIALGASSWRIEEITHDRVLVSAAPGRAARVPFWMGDFLGRPVELGKALGRQVADAAAGVFPDGLDDNARANIEAYVREQKSVTRHLPDDRTVVVERFRDPLGDWRFVIHCLLGARVNAPWAQLIIRRLEEHYGFDPYVVPTDDGIIIRIPSMEEVPTADFFLFDSTNVASAVSDHVSGTPLFAARFRECASRGLLLPRRDPRRRQPLWQQRQRAAQLLNAARHFADFPMTVEAARECLQDVYDIPELANFMADIAARRIRLVEVETPTPSPFARSQLLRYTDSFIYGEDAPLAERHAAVLSADSGLLAELLGEVNYSEILDPVLVAEAERHLQWRDGRRLASAEDLAELLRVVGDLSPEEAAERGVSDAWIAELRDAHRVVKISVGGQLRYISAEDATRYAEGVGAELLDEVTQDEAATTRHALQDLVLRFAATHGPFSTVDLAARWQIAEGDAESALHALAASGRIVSGKFTVDAPQWCHADVLALLRRRSLSALRAQIAPVEPATYAAFLLEWQGVGEKSRNEDLESAVELLQGSRLPASAVETLVLPSRVVDYSPMQLDELVASGELAWAGSGALSGGDGWITFSWAENVPLLVPEADASAISGPVHEAIIDLLGRDQAVFFRDIRAHIPEDDASLVEALWDLVWGGHISNDTFTPLRAYIGGRGTLRSSRNTPRSRVRRPRPSITTLRSGPSTAGGRWYRLPPREPDMTRRLAAYVEALIERNGVLLRGAVTSPGGFAGVYPLLAAAEERGSVRRGYFVEGCGAAQFADPAVVDRLRTVAREGTVVLAACDPANPYGAGVEWPEPPHVENDVKSRPARRAGALIVIDRGEMVLFVERGGRSIMSYTSDQERLRHAARVFADTVRDGNLGRFTVERVNGRSVIGTSVGDALREAGFGRTPKGLRL